MTSPWPMAAPVPQWPRLAELLKDPSQAGSLIGLAGLARPAILDAPFVVGTASGGVTPTFTAQPDLPGREEVGLLGPVFVRLSLQRLVTITVQTDSGRLVFEQFASGGLKKPDRWSAFERQAQVIVTNPSSSFYVSGLVYATIWYLKRPVFDALRAELKGVLPPADAEQGMSP